MATHTHTRTNPWHLLNATSAAVLLLLGAAFAAPLAAQTPDGERIGHIVAVVGDSAVLNFDIQQGILAYEAETGTTAPRSGPEYDELYRQVLDTKIAELLFVQAALQDTMIKVLDDQIMRAVQAKIDEDERRLGGVAQLETALRTAGLTPESYRAQLAVQYRKRALIQQFQEKIRSERKPPPATEADLRTQFEAMKAQLGLRPATVTFQQVLVHTTASDSALARARAKADSVRTLIREGEDFETAARRFGEDATRERGGDLGWIRRGDVVREFAAAAFNLPVGAVSAPVRTQHGFHLIKVERARGAEIQVRHILIRPELTTEDAIRARARADTVAARLRAGADAEDLAEQYGDPDLPVRWGPSELVAAQDSLGLDLTTTSAGHVFDPIPMGGDDVASQFLVLRVVEREAERPWSLDDAVLRENLRNRVEAEKFEREIIEELRRAMYVEIR